jgi:hypothetical protein
LGFFFPSPFLCPTTRSNIRATSFPWNHRNGDRPAYRIHQPIVEKAGERGANR